MQTNKNMNNQISPINSEVEWYFATHFKKIFEEPSYFALEHPIPICDHWPSHFVFHKNSEHYRVRSEMECRKTSSKNFVASCLKCQSHFVILDQAYGVCTKIVNFTLSEKQYFSLNGLESTIISGDCPILSFKMSANLR